ncbi:Retrovirus-related Pol polyprotein from transposon opus [Araneus ventricosus]|uniref:Retrovirus-related Pol polyprotein from transposon opus n=1 Tax=Araneus ventricosus TaxID=182803 RepID=A0A4Y2L5J9_ARAVE|nr:Retrovirus-related Pol polyprotein from transposon opus [Araneus ventricosus]
MYVAQTFQSFIDNVVRDSDFCIAYLDDIFIFSGTEEQHRLDLDRVLLRLSDFGLLINFNKCVFRASKGHFLGYLVSKDCIQPLPEKVKVLLDFYLPKFVEQLCRVLAMIRFYHKFLKDAAKVKSCLNDLTKRKSKSDKTPLFWTENEEIAFKKVKKEIADASSLAHPLPDAKLSLVVEALDFVLGAVLQQSVIQENQALIFLT